MNLSIPRAIEIRIPRTLHMGERTIRKDRDKGILLSQEPRPPRTYRTRPDSLEAYWPEIEALLDADPRLKPVALLEWLKQKYNDSETGEAPITDSIRRTLKRRVQKWKLDHGVQQEVTFALPTVLIPPLQNPPRKLTSRTWPSILKSRCSRCFRSSPVGDPRMLPCKSSQPSEFTPSLLHRFTTLILIAAPAVLSICPSKKGLSAENQSVPNVVLILADDLGYSDLGCYGGEIETPNIDALAANGARLTQVYNSGRCCPTRASLMTGLYPSQAGIGDFTTREPSKSRGPGYLGRLNDQSATMAEVLGPAGYGCYYVGKWHLHPETGPIKRGFDEFYGYTDDHSHDQYDADYYVRLPAGRQKEIDPPADEFYATDVFNDYAVEFIKQGQKSNRPWFLFLGHSSPHFPVQAPPERADKYEETYLRGWDVLREERFERMQKLGLIDGDRWKLTPRSLVPVDRNDIANGYAGQPNPAWSSLDKDRQRDLARRMAIFAAMVESVDRGVGQIVDHLKATGDFENTLILFLSDNGACYEWGPFGFDGVSRKGTTILRTGEDLRKIGGPGTHQSYGSAWANLGNTPFRLYKHFTHEGGISTPFIAHWPKKFRGRQDWIREPAHVMDVLPTLIEASGAEYPSQRNGKSLTPLAGVSLLPLFQGESLPIRSIGFDHQGAHALRRGDWKIVWSKRMPHEIRWELYNLAEDRCELNDLADEQPERVQAMAEEWDQWARHVGVLWEPAADANSSVPIVDTWKYTLRRPAEGWRSVKFDEAGWKESHGGFGTRETPGARVGTTWATDNIWLRKSFELKAVPEKPALLIHHDEDAEVFLNGEDVARLKGFITEYKVVPIPEDKLSALKVGKNVMAVHCRQTGGGQFIDVHLIDADNVPKLPEPKRSTKPFESELITKWGAEVTAENAWTEYPRPQMQRENWQNLNGHWDYAITPVKQTDVPTKWNGKILVPYCLESKLGGVQRLLDASEALWYRRTFKTNVKEGTRTLLNFEAVDYRSEVFVNGRSVGKHQGGNTPFAFDISGALKDGENELIVRVEDETEKFQLRGKQTLNPRGIWYTQVSGIWQTVWLEEVPSTYIEDLKLITRAKEGELLVKADVNGNADAAAVHVIVRDSGKVVAEARSKDFDKGATVKMPREALKLWSPKSPHLYDVEVQILGADGQALDSVKTYAGLRDVGKTKDADGHWRFTLNGEPIFHWGPLDQGWWPDGLLTPPSDEAMLFEIEWLKSAGFNMIRKHIKVEPRRYYYHCDRLGMLVWQDQVSGGPNPPWTRLTPNPKDADWPDRHHNQYMLELERMIDLLENHPAIVCWVPFNEAWGQHRTLEVGKWTAKRDPTRLVNIASGGNFWPAGDVVDAHAYPHPNFPFNQGANGRFDGFIKVMGEFGGHGYPVQGHLWDEDRRNWGYGGLPKNEAEYRERYVTSLKLLNELRHKGIAAGVYTQTTDVEGEINGLMTYDRKVIKIPAKELAELHKILFDTP